MEKWEIDKKEFSRGKREAEVFYKQIGEVNCPYLRRSVHFNVEGLRHLKFKAWRRARKLSDQYVRLKLLWMAPEVLKLSRTVQGIYRVRRLERQMVNSRWEQRSKAVTYYEFIAVVKERRVRVIVKEIADSEPIFWSIIPFWKMDRERGKRILHGGDPERD